MNNVLNSVNVRKVFRMKRELKYIVLYCDICSSKNFIPFNHYYNFSSKTASHKFLLLNSRLFITSNLLPFHHITILCYLITFNYRVFNWGLQILTGKHDENIVEVFRKSISFVSVT